MGKQNISKQMVVTRERQVKAIVKCLVIAGTITVISSEALAVWDLSASLRDTIVTPITKAVKDFAAPIIGVAAAGGLMLGVQGDLRERSKIAGVGFLGAYGVVEVIKAMSGM